MEITAEAIARAIKWDMCLGCGKKLTRWRASVVDAFNALSLRADRPQSCRECATADATSRPAGVWLVWISRMKAQTGMLEGKAVFQLPEADALLWYTDGRAAYRDEAVMALKLAVPGLLMACKEAEEVEELGRRVAALVPNLPRNPGPALATCFGCRKSTDDVDVIKCVDGDCPLLADLVAF